MCSRSGAAYLWGWRWSVWPTTLAGKEKNWLRTVPGKGYFVILRLYGPTAPFSNQS
jgi:hypothetical protein